MGKEKESVKFNIYPQVFRRWPMMIVGFGDSHSIGYGIYKLLLLLFTLYMLSMALYVIILVRHEIIYAIGGVHFATANYLVSSTMVLRLLTNKPLLKMSEMSDRGIFNYGREGFDHVYRKIQENILQDLNWKAKIYIVVYLTSFTLVMFVSPFLGYLCIPEDSRFFLDPVVNNYLPHIFYSPFGNRSTLTFFVAYVLDVLCWGLACTTTMATLGTIVYTAVQLKLQLRILNYSLTNIQTRALRLYEKKFGVPGETPSLEQLLKKKEFQDCLYSCLRANIRHHHTLLTFKSLSEPFNAPTLLAIYSVVVAILYAALLYLILQPLPISMKLKYICMLASEETAGFFTSSFGEDVINESGKVFESLYKTPWFHYNKKFKQSMHIMMSCTRIPMRFKAKFLDASASKESFAELIKVTYSITNIIGSSEKMD